MEFFAEVQDSTADSKTLKDRLGIHNLPAVCASISSVLSDQETRGRIYCLWGEFDIQRDEIRDGVRFALNDCPNALAWTVTADGNRQALVVHCTINTRQHDDDFIESIEQFVGDWADGLKKLFTRD